MEQIDTDLLNEFVTFLTISLNLFDVLGLAITSTLQNALPMYYTL